MIFSSKTGATSKSLMNSIAQYVRYVTASRASTGVSTLANHTTHACNWQSLWFMTGILTCVLATGCVRVPKPTTSVPVAPSVTTRTPASTAVVSAPFSIVVKSSLIATFTTETAFTSSSSKGTNLRFQGNLSRSTLGYKIVAWTWNFGDGTVCDQGTCGLMGTAHFFKHNQPNDTKYTVTLTITDDHNNVAQTSADMTP